MVAGGEFGQVHGEVTRLRDYWMLDLVNYQWKMLQGEMPCDLIEPRLCVTNTGIKICCYPNLRQVTSIFGATMTSLWQIFLFNMEPIFEFLRYFKELQTLRVSI